MGITLLIILFTTTAIAAPVFLGNKPNSGSKSPNKLVGIDCRIIKTCDADTGAAFGSGPVVPKFEGRSGNFDDCEALGNCDVNLNGRSGVNESDEVCNEDEQTAITEDPYPYQLDVRFGGERRSREKKCTTKATSTARPKATRKPITMATDDIGYVTQGVTRATTFPTPVTEEDVGRFTQGVTYTVTFSTPVTEEDVRDVTQGVTYTTTFSTPVTKKDVGRVTQGATYTTTFFTPVPEDQVFSSQSSEPTVVTDHNTFTTEMGITNGMYVDEENDMRPPTTNSGFEAVIEPSTEMENGYITQTTEAVIEQTPGEFQQTFIPTSFSTTVRPGNNFGFVPGFGNTYRPFVDCYAAGTCNSGFNVPGFANTGCRGGRCGGAQTNFGGFDQFFGNFGNRGQAGGNPFGNFFNVAGK